MFDFIIREAIVVDRAERVDVAVQDGRIARISSAVMERGRQEISIDGRFVFGGFINPHIHLDKSYIGLQAPTVPEALENTVHRKKRYTVEGVKERARRGLDMAILNGTTAMRTCVDVDPYGKLVPVQALLEVREEYRGRIDLQIIAFPQEGILRSPGTEDLMREAVRMGVDVVGGMPHREKNPEDLFRHADIAFGIAVEFDRPVDMSIDAVIPPGDFDAGRLCLPYLAGLTLREGYQGRVNAHHCLALGAAAPDDAGRIIEKVAEAGMTVVTNPSSNLYTEGRNDAKNPRRGLTRVKELIAAGVPVAYGTDNIDDPFVPFVHNDPVVEGFVAACAIHLGATDEERRVLFNMSTVFGAEVLSVRDRYGVKEGNPADLVVLDTDSPLKVVTHFPERLYVFKTGRLVAVNRRVRELLPV